jgi:menaquinone-dependent protoporphyrinogen oxidase
MTKIQVVYASRHGGTAGIARRIGEVLRNAGAEVAVVDAETLPGPTGYDGYIVGSGVYMGSWLKDGVDYLARNQATLATKPVWLFSSGPIPNPKITPKTTDRIEEALGPADGPGSGGRKKVMALANAIRVRGHAVFAGRYDPDDPPQNFLERVARLLPAVKNVLPKGDFRPWPDIDRWAQEIASEVVAPSPA